MKSASDFQKCAEQLKALADPGRLRIVLCLFGGEKTVGQIAQSLDEEIVKISHHLGVLRHANIVSTERRGRCIIYRLHPKVTVVSDPKHSDRSIDFGCCVVDLTHAGRRQPK